MSKQNPNCILGEDYDTLFIMPDGSSVENISPPTISRRTALHTVGKLATAAVLGRSFMNPSPAEAQTTNPLVEKEKAEKPQTIFDWDKLYTKIDGLNRLETDRESRGVLSEIKGQIAKLAETSEPQAKRLKEIAKLANEKKDVKGMTLMDYYQKILHGKEHLTVEDIAPFLYQFRSMQQNYDYLDQSLQNWIKSKQEIINQNLSNDYVDLKKGLVDRQKSLDELVYEKSKPNEQDDSGVTILVDPNIRLTKEGNSLFINQRKAIGKFLEKFPYFKKLYTKVLLFSSDYGEVKDQSKYLGHTFQSRKQESGKTQLGHITIDMGTSYKDESDPPPMWPERTFAHEAFGHATDTSLNESLAQRLSPEEYVERRLFEEAILDNPDWGDHDQTIPQLFSNFNNTQPPYSLEDIDQVDRSQFMKLITYYPRNAIYYNGYHIPKPDVLRAKTLFDTAAEDPTPGNPMYDKPPELPASTQFENFDSFLHSYLPLLQRSAQEGNKRSQIILWGINNFKKDFEKIDSLWNIRYGDQNFDPKYNKSGATWSNFCNTIILNTSLYHVFSKPAERADQTDAIRAMFTDQQRRNLEWQTYDLKRAYRYELWGEGNAYSHTLGNRVMESPPYRSGLNQLASLVSK